MRFLRGVKLELQLINVEKSAAAHSYKPYPRLYATLDVDGVDLCCQVNPIVDPGDLVGLYARSG